MAKTNIVVTQTTDSINGEDVVKIEIYVTPASEAERRIALDLGNEMLDHRRDFSELVEEKARVMYGT